MTGTPLIDRLNRNGLVSTGLGMAVAAALGLCFWLLHLPLAWLLGPLIGAAAVSLAGLNLRAPVAGRRLGQMIIGIGIGLHVTAAIAASLVVWLPAMVAAALFGVAAAAVLSAFFARLAKIDDATAFYAMLPGGLAEMANVGASDGARPEPISLTQALRVGLVVLIIPPLIFTFGIDQGIVDPVSGTIDWWVLLPLLGVAGLGVGAARLLRMQNGWMIGSLLAVGLVSAFGWPNGQMLPFVTALAQYLIGINVGARFQREMIARLPRVAAVGTAMIVLLTGVMFAFAGGLALLTGIDVATATLATSPGGLAEMASTAQGLHLGLVLLTGFHVVRAITVNAFARHLRAVMEALRILPAARWLASRTVA